MGLDIHKYVVYGMFVTKQEITRIDKDRVCYHDTDTTKNFCSECGAPVWETTENPILDGNEEKGLSYFYMYNDLFEKLKVDTPFLLGFCLAHAGSHRLNTENFVEVPAPQENMAQTIKEFCEAHNITFDENKLKTYTFNYYSY